MREYLGRVWRLRHFWLALVRIDLRNRYRRSMIGMGWSLLHPLAMTAVICTVFSQLFKADIATFGPFLLAGLTTWNFITAVMNQGCQSFFQNESYIRQHPAPLAIYPLRVTLGAGVHLLLGLAGRDRCSPGAMDGFGNLRGPAGLLPALALLLIFGWSLAILMGVVNVLFQDTQHLTEMLLQILFYLTPIMYPPDARCESGTWAGSSTSIRWPSFLELIRRPIFEGRLPSLGAYGVAAGTVLLAAAAGHGWRWRASSGG